MAGTRPRRGLAHPAHDRLHFESTAIALIFAAVAVVAVLVVLSPPATTTLPVHVALAPDPNGTLTRPGPDFWGANVGLNVPVSTTLTSAFLGTSATLVRWPGGAAGDALNYTTGILTNVSGAQYPAAMSLSAFVTWCRSVDCHALLELPGEIDDPATAAYYVRYTEGTLGFYPSYWEVGNEPAIWTHFGIPWSAWNASQTVNATPAAYAAMLHGYIAAIRAVDPTAAILGLPGVGTGMSGEATWIAATILANGPDLSGVGIHVYPAGATTLGNPTPSQFFANATGPRSFATRVAIDRATIASVDASDPTLPLCVTELGSGNNPGGPDTYLQGYDNVPFIASELLTGLDANVSQMDLTQVQTPQAGAWLDGNGSFHPLYTLYRAWLPDLGPIVEPARASVNAPGLFWTLTSNGSSGPTTLLVDNTNVSVPVELDASALGLGPGVALHVWAWNGAAGGPTESSVAGAPSSGWLVPPLGLLMLRTSGPDAAAAHAGGAGASMMPAKALSISTAEARWRWEICSTLTPIATPRPAAAAPARTSR